MSLIDHIERVEAEASWETWNPSNSFFRVHAIAGSAAGVAEHFFMFPLDTAKTQLQALGPLNSKDTTSSSFINGSRLIKLLYQRQGLWGFYRGALTITAGSIPAHAAYFSAYELLRRATIFRTTDQQALPEYRHTFFGGAISGATATLAHDFILSPLDTVKQRLQLGCYRGALDCMRCMCANEGVYSLFRSLPTTLLMNVPFGAIVVGTNESFKRFLHWVLVPEKNENSGTKTNSDLTKIQEPHKFFHYVIYFFCAGISGGIAGALTNPLDVVKTRLQTQDCYISSVRCQKSCPIFETQNPLPLKTPAATRLTYLGFISTATLIWSTEGYRIFGRGMLTRAVLCVPATGVSWCTYEFAKRKLQELCN